MIEIIQKVLDYWATRGSLTSMTCMLILYGMLNVYSGGLK
jgi:hypothetical protein